MFNDYDSFGGTTVLEEVLAGRPEIAALETQL